MVHGDELSSSILYATWLSDIVTVCSIVVGLGRPRYACFAHSKPQGTKEEETKGTVCWEEKTKTQPWSLRLMRSGE